MNFTTLWQSGLRRWLKAPFRKGEGSNTTGVIIYARRKHSCPAAISAGGSQAQWPHSASYQGWEVLHTTFQFHDLEQKKDPHRLVVRTSRCGRDNPGSTPGAVISHTRGPCVCNIKSMRFLQQALYSLLAVLGTFSSGYSAVGSA